MPDTLSHEGLRCNSKNRGRAPVTDSRDLPSTGGHQQGVLTLTGTQAKGLSLPSSFSAPQECRTVGSLTAHFLLHGRASELLSCTQKVLFSVCPVPQPGVYHLCKAWLSHKAWFILCSLQLYPHSQPTLASSAFNMPCWAVAKNTQQIHIKNAL